MNDAEARHAELGARLELSKLRLEQRFEEAGASPEEFRWALADWVEENSDMIGEKRALWNELNPPVTAPSDPAELPNTEGLFDQEIVDRLAAYFDHETRRLRGSPETIEERRDARVRLGEWLERADIAALRQTQKDALARIRAAEMEALREESSPYSEAEIAALPPLEAVEARMHNLLLEAYGTEPLAEGERLRDRFGKVEAELLQLRAQFSEALAARRRADRDSRIDELERILD